MAHKLSFGGGGSVGLAPLGAARYGLAGYSNKFGCFNPPGLPFSASDSEKLNAPIIETTEVYLEDYPVGYEMVRAEVSAGDLILSKGTPITFMWANIDLGQQLFTYQFIMPFDGYLASAKSWIGHKSSGEIDRVGNYSCLIYIGPGGSLYRVNINFKVLSHAKNIQETINWEASVPSGQTHTFHLFSCIGKNTNWTKEGFQIEKITHKEVTTQGGSRQDVLTTNEILEHDCLTVIAENADGSGVYDWDIYLGAIL